MTDRYTELVKQAYEAQQAREGEAYKTATFDLTSLDQQLAELSRQRENVVAALEAMDDAIEAAKEALDAYFAGRDEDADGPAEMQELAQAYSNGRNIAHGPLETEEEYLNRVEDMMFGAIEPLPTEEETWDETASAKAAGALS